MRDEDNELVKRGNNGNRDAFGKLLEKHYDLISRVDYRFIGKRDDAEEMAQTVCIGLAEKLRSFRGDSLPTTWLYRVVVNSCRNNQRNSATAQRIDQTYSEIAEFERLEGRDNAERSRTNLRI
jgi:RNA polymerase sigma-70 factor (ECF subfamily)